MLEFVKDNRDFRLRVVELKIGRVSIGCLVILFKYNFFLMYYNVRFFYLYRFIGNFSKFEVKYKSMLILFLDV